MSERSIRSSQTLPDSPSQGSIWRGSPSGRESAASWGTRMELQSLLFALGEERTPSERQPSGRWQQSPLGEATSSWQIPPSQPQPPTLREPTLSGQTSSEQPSRAPTRRSGRIGSTQPRTTTPAANPFVRQVSQPRSIPTPQLQQVSPPANRIAVYLAVFEGHPRRYDPFHLEQPSRRNCSIMVQTNPQTNKFREFCCIATPKRRPKRHVQFYSSPEIPDPRWGCPGLLAMQFIAWLPREQIERLDGYMKTWRCRVENSWTHNTWINLYLGILIRERLITLCEMERAIVFQDQALHLPYTEDLPNDRQCFPHLY